MTAIEQDLITPVEELRLLATSEPKRLAFAARVASGSVSGDRARAVFSSNRELCKEVALLFFQDMKRHATVQPGLMRPEVVYPKFKAMGETTMLARRCPPLLELMKVKGLSMREVEETTLLGVFLQLAPDLIFPVPRLSDPGQWEVCVGGYRAYALRFTRFLGRAMDEFLGSSDALMRKRGWKWTMALARGSEGRRDLHFVDRPFVAPLNRQQEFVATRSPGGEDAASHAWMLEGASPSALLALARVHVESALELYSHGEVEAHLGYALLDLKWGAEEPWSASLREIALVKETLGIQLRGLAEESWEALRGPKELVLALLYLEVGYLPELESLRSLRKAHGRHPEREDLRSAFFFREATLADPDFVLEAVRLCCLGLEVMAKDAAERSSLAATYPQFLPVAALTVLGTLWEEAPQVFVENLEMVRSSCLAMLRLLSSETCISNPWICFAIVTLLRKWAVDEKMMEGAHHRLYDCERVAKRMHRSLLKYGHVRKVERVASMATAVDSMLMELLAFVWDRPCFREARGQRETDGMTVNSFQFWCLEATRWIAEASKYGSMLVGHTASRRSLEEDEVEMMQSTSKRNMTYAKHVFHLLTRLNDEEAEAMEEAMGAIVDLLVTTLDAMTASDAPEVFASIDCPFEHFLECVVEACSRFEGRPIFTKAMAFGCSAKQLEHAVAMVNRHLRSEGEAKRSEFALFYASMQQVIERVEARKPDERFRDASTGKLMLDPVILPSSEKRVDHHVMRRLADFGGVDPFTRVSLANEPFRSDETLCDEINAFWNSIVASFNSHF